MTFSLLGIDTETGERVTIPKSSRLQGLYLIGSPGTGKTGLIENLIIQDIEQDIGVCLLDPHGDLTQAVLARVPAHREQDVIYLDIANEDYPFGLNLFACSDPKSAKAVQYAVDQVMHVFEKLFDTSRATPLLSEYLRNCTHTLVVNQGCTMAEIPKLLLDPAFRKTLVANVIDPDVRLFWQSYEQMKSNEQREEAASTLRRVREFLQPLARNIVGQSFSTIDLLHVMDERKILLVKLDARLSSVTSLIGSVIVAQLLNAAYARGEIPLKKRKQFHIYADEFQRFATEDFATLLTEARKFGIGTTIAHQNRGQLDQQNRAATVNAANIVVFKISGQDAEELAGEFDSTPPPSTEVRQVPLLTPTLSPFMFLRQHTHRSKEINVLLQKLVTPFFDVERVNNGIDVKHYISAGHDFASTCNKFLFFAMIEKISSSPNLQTLLFTLLQNTLYIGQQGIYNEKINPVLSTLLSYYKETFFEIEEDRYETSLGLGFEAGVDQDIAFPTINDTKIIFMSFFASYLGKRQFSEEGSQELSNERYRFHLRRVYAGDFKKGTRLRESEKRALQKIESLIQEITDELEKIPKPEHLYYYDREKRGNFFSLSAQPWTPTPKEVELRANLAKERLYQYRYFLSDTLGMGDVFDYKVILERMAEARRKADEDIQKLTRFVADWLDLAQLLYDDPILENSGQFEKTPAIQRTFADMQNEITNELVKLPKSTARVKLSDGSGNTIEHTIQTIKPARGLDGKALQDKLDKIRQQNLNAEYLKDRVTVEAEIIQRQQDCTQLFQGRQNKFSPPPPAQRRVPLCSKCGASNRQGAKFCNQCGKAL